MPSAVLCLVALLLHACAATATPTPTLASASTPTSAPTPTPTPDLTPTPSINVPVAYTYDVVRTYPHDEAAFTQGLVYADGYLYESTGLYGRSSLCKVEVETGRVLQQRSLVPNVFGEGLALYGDRLVQLTWQSHVGFVYDRDSFEVLDQFTYPTEGWGITYDGAHLIMSDGSATLHFLDPETFAEVKTVEASDQGGPVTNLNELEYIDGEIYANVWLTDRIVRIAPDTGTVTGWIDLTGLLAPEYRTETTDVLNGIAYDRVNDRLFVTGKLWPRLFEIRLVVQHDEG